MGVDNGHGYLFPLLLAVTVTAVAVLVLSGQTKVQPSSHITAIDTRTGVVSAKVNASGEDFQFTLSKAALLGTLKIGQGVYASFQAKQVSLDGQHVVGTIVSVRSAKGPLTPTAPGKAPNSPPAPQPQTSPKAGGGSAPPAVRPSAACCVITSINAPARLASAKEDSTAQGFEFSVPDAVPMQSLYAGQPVWANFKLRKVSLDGTTPCCTIVSGPSALPAGRSGQSQVSTEKTSSISAPGIALPAAPDKRRAAPTEIVPSSTEKPSLAPSSSAGAGARGADPFVLIDPTLYHTVLPAGIGQQGTLYFANVTTGNQGTVPSNNNYTVNLTVTDASGKTVCSVATDVTTALDPNLNFTALRVQVRQSSLAQSMFAATVGTASPNASLLVPYTLNTNLRFWQMPTDPTADLSTQNDQAQATVNLPSGTVECVVASPPQIQAFKVIPTVMPGGQQGYGTILLNTPPTFALTSNGSINETLNLQLSSNQPQVTVPASVSIQYPNLVADFPVNTSPVAALQTATVSATNQAQTGSSTTVTVRPPQLLSLACLPIQVASGTPIHCTVQLDGKVYGPSVMGVRQTVALGSTAVPVLNNFVTVNLATDRPALVHPPATVNVFGGNDTATVDIPTVGDTQGGQVTVSASQAGVSRTATVNLSTAMIKSFGCWAGVPIPQSNGNTCTITPWSGKPYGLVVTLTAPQSQGLQISVTEPGRYHHASCALDSVSIPGGTPGIYTDLTAIGECFFNSCANHVKLQGYKEYFEPVPQTETHTLIARDPLSGATYTTTFVVTPARIVAIGFGPTLSSSQSPLNLNSVAGQNLTVWVSFDSPPAPTDWDSVNAWLDVRYGGNVTVQGPTNVAIHEQDFCNSIVTGPQHYWSNFDTSMSFDSTVGACSAAVNPNGCTATVTVSSNQALSSQTGTINVTPQ